MLLQHYGVYKWKMLQTDFCMNLEFLRIIPYTQVFITLDRV